RISIARRLTIFFIFFCTLLRPPSCTLFPYTTLFRSHSVAAGDALAAERQHRLAAARRLCTPAADRPVLHPHQAADGVSGRTVLRSEEHTSELQSRENLVCRLLLEKKKDKL